MKILFMKGMLPPVFPMVCTSPMHVGVTGHLKFLGIYMILNPAWLPVVELPPIVMVTVVAPLLQWKQ